MLTTRITLIKGETLRIIIEAMINIRRMLIKIIQTNLDKRINNIKIGIISNPILGRIREFRIKPNLGPTNNIEISPVMKNSMIEEFNLGLCPKETIRQRIIKENKM